MKSEGFEDCLTLYLNFAPFRAIPVQKNFCTNKLLWFFKKLQCTKNHGVLQPLILLALKMHAFALQ
jgi:hypothetical protein